jgi:F0F1-type ATP synthase membrane subunit b/b'
MTIAWEWIGLIVQAIIWLGSLIWVIASQRELNRKFSESIIRIEQNIKDVDNRLDKVAEERRLYNEEHFVAKEQYAQCIGEIGRRLAQIDAAKIQERLAGIEATLKRIENDLNRGK